MEMKFHFNTLIVFLGVFIIIVNCLDPITPNEQAALKKFYPMVKDHLTNENMKTDEYLIRWVRAKKLDLGEAKEFLLKSLEWRRENKIDDVVKLDTTSPMAKAFPSYLTVSREGLPVYIQDWSGDIRKVALGGAPKRKEFAAATSQVLELAEKEIYRVDNVSQFIGVYDFNKFTLTSHLCIPCLPMVLQHASNYEYFYPMRGAKFFVINAPRAFQALLRLIAPIIGNTIKLVSTYDTNRDVWLPELLKYIAEDQLPKKYGGTRVD